MQPTLHLGGHVAPSSNDLVAIAGDMLAQDGLGSVSAAFELLTRDPRTQADERAQIVLVEGLVLLIEGWAKGRTALVLDTIASFSPSLAVKARELLIAAHFPDGAIDARLLDDANIICIAALIGQGGDKPLAFALLDEQGALRRTTDFQRADLLLRGWLLGHGATAAALWRRRLPDDLTDLGHVRQRARAHADAGEANAALAAFATALTLPVDIAGKQPVIEDLALYIAFLRTLGTDPVLIDMQRLQLGLASQQALCFHAVTWLADVMRDQAAPMLPPVALADARDYFEDFVNSASGTAVTAYPVRDGKPYVDTVWVEITNFCNQKCTFCPDMHREDPREWMPLESVKHTIDQLAEGVSVGSMQLNAYGEPLLHPHIDEILAYIREKKLPWPTFFTSHGMTLVDKKLKQLSNNYPQGIAISLHNDGQASYEATRSAKIGDYETLVSRVSALMRQMVDERAPTHLRLYQMVANGREDKRVRTETRRAFPDTVERLLVHVRKWQAIARDIANAAPAEAQASVFDIDLETATARFHEIIETVIPILEWTDVNGRRQKAFMSTRPVDNYANLLFEYDADWSVGRSIVNQRTCHFVRRPSLAIFATGRLGICCIDMNSTATFASLGDYPDIASALRGPEAMQFISQLANGVATSRGCQICLSDDTRKCGELLGPGGD